MLSMDLLLVVLQSDGISDVKESISSLVDAVVIYSWHVLMSGIKLSRCISTPP
jgi:hypothetical protein